MDGLPITKAGLVNFKNTIIIMTSNLGSHLIQERFEKMTDKNKDEIWQQTREEVFNLLKQTIRPEFLNRIDDIIMFKPLTLNRDQRSCEIAVQTATKPACRKMALQFQ